MERVVQSVIVYCSFTVEGTAEFDLYSNFPVRDILIHPATAYLTAGTGVAHIISTDLVGGAVQILSKPSLANQMGGTGFQFYHRFGAPKMISGTYHLSLLDMSTTDVSSVTGQIALPIEMIGYLPTFCELASSGGETCHSLVSPAPRDSKKATRAHPREDLYQSTSTR